MACFKLFIVVALVTACCEGLTSSFDADESFKNTELSDVKPDYYDNLQTDISSKFKPIYEALNLKDNREDHEKDFPPEMSNEFNCDARSKFTKPYTVKRNGTTAAVVQTDYYEQWFRTTECAPQGDDMGENAECFSDFTLGRGGNCRTKYTVVVVYIYNTGKGTIERHPVPIPVCCICSIS